MIWLAVGAFWWGVLVGLLVGWLNFSRRWLYIDNASYLKSRERFQDREQS